MTGEDMPFTQDDLRPFLDAIQADVRALAEATEVPTLIIYDMLAAPSAAETFRALTRRP